MPAELAPVWPAAPRFGPDLPFPPYRFLAGLHPHPERDPDGHSHGADRPELTADEAFRRGVDLYHAGYLWEAHEAWEGPWKASDDPLERDFLQGLIQLAAALIKAHVGRPRGRERLAASARAKLARVAAATPRRRGLDVARLVADLDRFFSDPVLTWDRAPRLALGDA